MLYAVILVLGVSTALMIGIVHGAALGRRQERQRRQHDEVIARLERWRGDAA